MTPETTENATPGSLAAYDPVPDLARLLCAAQRQGHPLPGLEFVLSHLMQGLSLPELAFSDEAEAAIRKALGAHADEDALEPLMTTHQGYPVDARDNIPKG